jgi:hypothetical protein
MSSGLKKVAKNVLSNANPGEVAFGMINAYVKKNPQYAPIWEQAKSMAADGNAEQKAKNMFSERGIDVVDIVDGAIKEIKE